MNTTGTDIAATATRFAGNTAYLHSQDLHRLGFGDGDLVTVARGGGAIRAYVRKDDAVAPGCLSLAHCWESADGEEDATNVLVSGDSDIQPINGMPMMTGLKVAIRPVRAELAPA